MRCSCAMLRVSLIAAILASGCIALPLHAADSADADADTSQLQEVVVTGSRIAVPANISATSPVQIVTSQEIQLEGQMDTTNLINRLTQNIINPAVDIGNNSNPLGEAGGIATADLRGLGPQRTLVLVDGKRLGPGDPNTANPNVASDLDQIPAALIERIDVVTGGASATYGSDAIAGVVNFIMRKNFEGVQVDGEYGYYQHDNHETALQSAEVGQGIFPPSGNVTDGAHRDFSILMGSNLSGGDGNITGYFSYHNQSPVAGSARDFADCEFRNTAIAGGPANGLLCNNSPNSNEFIVNNSPYSVVGSQFLPYPQAGSSPPAQFNSAAYEYLQRQDERYNAGLFAHLDVQPYLKPYLDVMYMDDKTTEVVGPSALFEESNLTPDGGYLVNCSNPLLSGSQIATLQLNGACTPAQIAADTANPGSASADLTIGRRNIEGGGRIAYFEHQNIRVVAGSTGALGDAFTYDAYGQFAYTTFFNSNTNYLNLASVDNALQVTGTAANPVCISGPPCVPYNIFTQGGVTPAQLAYLYSPGTAYGQNWEEVQHVDVTAELGKLGVTSPLAHDGIGLNGGLEHRFEGLSFAPDGTELGGDLSGFGGAAVAIDKGFEVKELFIEGRAPLIQDRPFAHDLTVDAGYRFSDYDPQGHTATYKFEVQWAPVQDFRLRYSFDRAIRAPNLIELFNPQSYGLGPALTTDPCAPTVGAGGLITTGATASLAQCAHTGVSAAQYGNGGTAGAVYTGSITQCPAGQCGQVLGGNSALSPEIAETYSLGFTFIPTFLRNFFATVDYYHINLKDVITAPPAVSTFNDCLNTGTPQDCAVVVRNHATGSLNGTSVASGGYILQTAINGGAELTSGIDVQVNYRLPMEGFGSLLWNLNGSWIQHVETTPFAGQHSYDCAGLYGAICGGPAPTWRHNLRMSWETPWDHLLLSAYWRFIGEVGLDQNTSDPTLHYATFAEYDSVDAHLPRMNYLDLSAIWQITPQAELRAGVNNVTDKDPPIVSQDVNGLTTPNSFPTYDFLGREFFVGVRLHL
jgi:iron complex outermembrane receptor protein